MRKKQPYTNKLSEVLEREGRTRKWLAHQLGVTDNTISNWCKQKTQPDPFKLKAIAELLDVELKDLKDDKS